MKSSGIIYYHEWDYVPNPLATRTIRAGSSHRTQKTRRTHASSGSSFLIGLGLIALAFGGIVGPLTPEIRMEAKYAVLRGQRALPGIQKNLAALFNTGSAKLLSFVTKQPAKTPVNEAKPAVPALFDPLKTPDGASIDPVNKEFSLVIPKIGVNAAVIPSVNPTKPEEYGEALKKGIAHSSLSYFPDEDGTVYLFSHSTNYEWFVGDLNAVFYLLKNLEEKDTVILFYKGTAYTYKITGKQIVKPTAVAYLAPQPGAKRLIMQTCWPPGSTTERLLIFADLVSENNDAI